jgi:hypothetical protein
MYPATRCEMVRHGKIWWLVGLGTRKWPEAKEPRERLEIERDVRGEDLAVSD